MPLRDRSNRRFIRLGKIRLGFRVWKCKNEGCGAIVRWDGHERQRCSQCDQMRVGLLYKGRPSKALFPRQADHFLLHDAPEVAEFYAGQSVDKVRELDVLLPFSSIEQNYDANYKVWAGGILVCQGDGEYVQYAIPHKVEVKNRETHVYNAPGDTLVSNGVACVAFDWNGEHFAPGDHVPCPGAAQGLYPHCAACGASGILKVMMADPGLFRFGYYQITSGSGRNHDTILGTLETMGLPDYRGFPFTLRLVEEPTTYLDDKKMRRKTNKWFLQLEPRKEETRELYSGRIAKTIGLPEPEPQQDNGLDWEQYDVMADDEELDESPIEAEVIESDEPSEPIAHRWTQEEASELINWTRNELIITDQQVLAALKVTRISDYPGDPQVARAAIKAYLAEVSELMPEAEPA